MSAIGLSTVAVIILVILVCLKTKLEHDIESGSVRESNNSSKNANKKSSKKENESKKTNVAKSEEFLFTKKLVIAFAGIIIEVVLVFLGITGALEFDNYLEKRDVLRNVIYTKAYIDEVEDAISEILDIYCSGKCDVDDIKFNVTINEAMLDVITDADEARRQIKPLAISFVFSIKEQIENLIQLMNEETFDDSNIKSCVEEILYQLDILSQVLSSIETCLDTGAEMQLKETIERLYNELSNHQTGLYLTR